MRSIATQFQSEPVLSQKAFENLQMLKSKIVPFTKLKDLPAIQASLWSIGFDNRFGELKLFAVSDYTTVENIKYIAEDENGNKIRIMCENYKLFEMSPSNNASTFAMYIDNFMSMGSLREFDAIRDLLDE